MISLSVSLSLWAHKIISQNHTAERQQILYHFTYGRGSILIWRRRNTLCTRTSGFVDDVIFPIIRLIAA